jgi:hypothetical protein
MELRRISSEAGAIVAVLVKNKIIEWGQGGEGLTIKAVFSDRLRDYIIKPSLLAVIPFSAAMANLLSLSAL